MNTSNTELNYLRKRIDDLESRSNRLSHWLKAIVLAGIILSYFGVDLKKKLELDSAAAEESMTAAQTIATDTLNLASQRSEKLEGIYGEYVDGLRNSAKTATLKIEKSEVDLVKAVLEVVPDQVDLALQNLLGGKVNHIRSGEFTMRAHSGPDLGLDIQFQKQGEPSPFKNPPKVLAFAIGDKGNAIFALTGAEVTSRGFVIQAHNAQSVVHPAGWTSEFKVIWVAWE